MKTEIALLRNQFILLFILACVLLAEAKPSTGYLPLVCAFTEIDILFCETGIFSSSILHFFSTVFFLGKLCRDALKLYLHTTHNTQRINK